MSRTKVAPSGLILPLPLQFLAPWLAVWAPADASTADRLPESRESSPEGEARWQEAAVDDADRRRLAVLDKQLWVDHVGVSR